MGRAGQGQGRGRERRSRRAPALTVHPWEVGGAVARSPAQADAAGRRARWLC